eukprot:scpid95866/ scgid13650/ 
MYAFVLLPVVGCKFSAPRKGWHDLYIVHWLSEGAVLCSVITGNTLRSDFQLLPDVPERHDVIFAVMRLEILGRGWIRIVSYNDDPVIENRLRPSLMTQRNGMLPMPSDLSKLMMMCYTSANLVPNPPEPNCGPTILEHMFTIGLQLEIGVPFIRMILLGETGSGKTSLVRSLCREKILHGKMDSSTVGVDESMFIIDGGQLERAASKDGEEMLRRRIASVIKRTMIHPNTFLAFLRTFCSASASYAFPNSTASKVWPERSSVTGDITGLTGPCSDLAGSKNELPQNVISDISNRVMSIAFIKGVRARVAERPFQIIRIW